MQFQVNVEELRKKPFMVATPAYGGLVGVPYHISNIDLINRCASLQISIRHCLIENESLITRARNNIIKIFMESPIDHLIFIDADIKFAADDVITLLALCDEKNPVVCAGYAKKGIKWDLVTSAVKHGVKPEDLSNFIDNPVFNFIPNDTGVHRFNLNEPIEVLDSGTGFMMIHKSAIKRMIEAYSSMYYYPDYTIGHNDFDNAEDKRVFAFFDTAVVKDEISRVMSQGDDSRRYLSEDYYFCHLFRKLGGKILLVPWIQLGHHGTFLYKSNPVQVLQLRQQEYLEKTQQVNIESSNATPAKLSEISEAFKTIGEQS